MKKKWALFLVIIFMLTSCKLWQKKTPLDDLMVETNAAPYALDSLSKGNLPLHKKDIDDMTLRIMLREFGLVDSLIVVYRDQICYEWYFNGYTRHIRHKMCSVGKSVLSLLTGVIIEKNIIALEEKALDVLAEDYPRDNVQNYNVLKEMITLKTCLKMSSGFSGNELRTPFFLSTGKPNPKNSLIQILSDNDSIGYLLDLPIITPPGLFFNYNSGEPMLAEAMLEKKTGQNISTMVEENLFSSCGISSFSWETLKDNATAQDGGLQMHPVDMAQLGRLVLKRGRLNNQQIVSEDWIAKSTSRQIAVSIPVLDKAVDGYGFYWWRLNDEEVMKYLRVNDVTFAWGFGGQIILVCPHLEVVIVSTGRNCNGFKDTIKLFKEVFIPLLQAIEESKRI